MAKLQKFFEYLNNHNTQNLFKYFKMTKEQIIDSLPYLYPELLMKFSTDEDVELGIYADYLDVQSYDYVDFMFEDNRELFDRFAEWLYSGVENHTLEIPLPEYPSWSFMLEMGIHKPNDWLVHFTYVDSMKNILRDGFTYGMANMNRLALTTAYDYEDKEGGGYNFAYDIDDAVKYGSVAGGYGDGQSIIMLRASGVKVWHRTDQEMQIIFDGASAKDIVGLTRVKDGSWVIVNNEKLVNKKTWKELAEWIEKNYDQYKNVLNNK
jgi:hypothetical protein